MRNILATQVPAPRRNASIIDQESFWFPEVPVFPGDSGLAEIQDELLSDRGNSMTTVRKRRILGARGVRDKCRGGDVPGRLRNLCGQG